MATIKDYNCITPKMWEQILKAETAHPCLLTDYSYFKEHRQAERHNDMIDSLKFSSGIFITKPTCQVKPKKSIRKLLILGQKV